MLLAAKPATNAIVIILFIVNRFFSNIEDLSSYSKKYNKFFDKRLMYRFLTTKNQQMFEVK